MKNYISILAIGIMMLTALGGSNVLATDDNGKIAGYRIAWLGGKLPGDKLLKTVKELNFNAVVFYWDKKLTPKAIQAAKKFDLDTYCWIFPVFPGNDKKRNRQQMTPAEELLRKAERELAGQGKLFMSGYQGGGEPLPGVTETIAYDIPCFHHPEVVTAIKQRIKEILDSSPGLTGLALDMFGYQNYHCCYCPTSMQAFEVYCKEHPKLLKTVAWQKFNLDTLVKFQNKLCDYARSLRSDIKLTNHVWPVYTPEPLYGNRLNVDYCAQTAAWFFKPYWSDEKITAYTRKIVYDAGRYHKNQQGLPFVGYFNRKNYPVKSAARLAHEVELIFANSGSQRNLAIYKFTDIAKTKEALEALKKVFEKYNIIQKKKSEKQ